MPSWPIEMPSETEIVPNSSGTPSAPLTPIFAFFASRFSDRLHGVISFHDDATPICGLRQSSSPMPTARNMPRAAAPSSPSVTIELWGLRCSRLTAETLRRSVSAMPSPSATIVLRLPRTAYLSVVLLLVGTVPLAFGGDDYRSIRDVANGTGHGGSFTVSWRVVL